MELAYHTLNTGKPLAWFPVGESPRAQVQRSRARYNSGVIDTTYPDSTDYSYGYVSAVVSVREWQCSEECDHVTWSAAGGAVCDNRSPLLIGLRLNQIATLRKFDWIG